MNIKICVYTLFLCVASTMLDCMQNQGPQQGLKLMLSPQQKKIFEAMTPEQKDVVAASIMPYLHAVEEMQNGRDFQDEIVKAFDLCKKLDMESECQVLKMHLQNLVKATEAALKDIQNHQNNNPGGSPSQNNFSPADASIAAKLNQARLKQAEQAKLAAEKKG